MRGEVERCAASASAVVATPRSPARAVVHAVARQRERLRRSVHVAYAIRSAHMRSRQEREMAEASVREKMRRSRNARASATA